MLIDVFCDISLFIGILRSKVIKCSLIIKIKVGKSSVERCLYIRIPKSDCFVIETIDLNKSTILKGKLTILAFL